MIFWCSAKQIGRCVIGMTCSLPSVLVKESRRARDNFFWKQLRKGKCLRVGELMNGRKGSHFYMYEEKGWGGVG